MKVSVKTVSNFPHFINCMNTPYHDREFAIMFVRHLKRLSRETFKVHIMHCSFAAMALRGLGSIFSEIKPISVKIASLCKGQDKQNFERKIVNIVLPISFNICFGCSKEPSHYDGSFEYPQHMFWLRSKKFNF